MYQSILAAPIPSWATVGHLLALTSQLGVGIYQPRGHPQAFGMHMVSYLNITKSLTTQKILLKYKQIGSSVKDGKN